MSLELSKKLLDLTTDFYTLNNKLKQLKICSDIFVYKDKYLLDIVSVEEQVQGLVKQIKKISEEL